MTKASIAIFASGNGSNAEEIIKYFKAHDQVEVAMLLSNDPNSYAIERAKRLGVSFYVFDRASFRDTDEVVTLLRDWKVSHIVLAGFLWLIPERLLHAFPDRIINIHPALLPKFGGKGMYGMKVHQAVKQRAENETGITIHLVNEKYDDGQILFQTSCAIDPSDTAEDIGIKVNQLEYRHYPRVIEKWILGQ